MIEVVVVDDEKLVLLGITSYISQAADRYRVTGAFTGARDALSFCRSHPPHILVTDIKMPAMDGLELIRIMKSELPQTQIVVLSCHDDYDYVRQSFQLGARDYVLKDRIEEAELVSVLDRIGCGAENGRPGQSLPARPGSYERLAADIRERSAGAGRAECHIVGVLGFKEQYDEQLNLVPWHFDEGVLLQMVRDVLDRFGKAEAAVCGGEHLVLVFCSDGAAGSRSAADKARHIAGEVLRMVAKYWNRHVLITLHDEPVDGGDLDRALRQALRCQDYAFYTNEDAVVLSSTAGLREQEQPLRPPQYSFGAQQVGGDWIEETRMYFRKLLGARNRHPAEVKGVLTGALMQLDERLRAFYEFGLDEVRGDELSVFERLNGFDDILALERWTCRLIEGCRARIRQSGGRSSVIRLVQAYVKEHYQEQISLKALAGRFNISDNYLCHCFKKETGSTLSKYLNKVRIEQAMQLAAATDWGAKRISYEVGYHTPSYFSRVFKQLTGKTLGEYRDCC